VDCPGHKTLPGGLSYTGRLTGFRKHTLIVHTYSDLDRPAVRGQQSLEGLLHLGERVFMSDQALEIDLAKVSQLDRSLEIPSITLRACQANLFLNEEIGWDIDLRLFEETE
jgi:hypothetical protein